MQLCYCFYSSPLGRLVMYGYGVKLYGLVFDCRKNVPIGIHDNSVPVFLSTKKWLDVYFGGKAPCFSPVIDFSGISPFGVKVLKEMLKVPYGEVTSYGAIARNIEAETGKRTSARAVGGAVGANRFAIIVPCHRVLGSDKSLVGYFAGLDKKIALLKAEKIILS